MTTETRTVQERLRGNSTACLVNGLPDTAALLSEAAHRIDAMEKALKELLEISESDPNDYGWNGEYESVLAEAQGNARAALSPPSDNEVKS